MSKLLKRIGARMRAEVDYLRAQQHLHEQATAAARVVVLEPEAAASPAVVEVERNRDVWRNFALTLERYLDATAGSDWRDHYAAWVREQGASNGPQPS